jgi:hypothetical protein
LSKQHAAPLEGRETLFMLELKAKRGLLRDDCEGAVISNNSLRPFDAAKLCTIAKR